MSRWTRRAERAGTARTWPGWAIAWLGVDASPEMLAESRRPGVDAPRLPAALADLHALPLVDRSVDVVVCGLALSYVPRLEPVLAEFARVLRPGGHLVISDAHVVLSYLRPPSVRWPAGPGGDAAIVAEYHRPLSDYLTAALPLGFRVRHCEEPRRPRRPPDLAAPPAPDPLPLHVSWELLDRCPEAARTVLEDSPMLVIWHFQLDA